MADLFSAQSGEVILWLLQEVPHQDLRPFRNVTEREVVKKDKNFIGKIMKLDWRDRPSAKELLRDEWWEDDA